MADTLELTFSPPQSELLLCDSRYVDAEGAIRSGKTWACSQKIADYVLRYPGIHCFIGRWSESDLDAQVKPVWRDVADQLRIPLTWHATEQYDGLPNGSRVYMRGLKAGEQTSRYAKFRGLTLAVIWIDQAEEVPEDVASELKGRLSQPGYPHQLIWSPNPPSEGHWLATEFPEDNSTPDHTYIRFTLRDNIALDPSTIEAIEAAYPEGTAQRRRLIDGRRGLASIGDPVYRGYFSRSHHVQHREMEPNVPLLEAWDFGHSHPAVVWRQNLPWGETRILGGVMGQGMFLEDFAPMALGYRARWCPHPMETWTTCDPAGDALDNQGIRNKATDILRQFGVHARPCTGGNHPEMRNTAIQRMSASMRRRTERGEAFTVHPQFAYLGPHGAKPIEVIVDGLEAGYVWDDKALPYTAPSTRKPKKDGWYDHTQNCLEYLELMFGTATFTPSDIARADAKALRLSQRDDDPYDRRVRVATRRGIM